ncbi:MAG: hypothetical protein IJ837_03965 [Clostridia bacterium]|nr:hypothetical protein [Clostridia bacterium]
MINLVVSYNQDLKTLSSNFHIEDKIFCIENFEEVSRRDRIAFFEELKRIENKLSKDCFNYYNDIGHIFKDSRFLPQQYYGEFFPKFQFEFITEPEMILFDAQRAFKGKKPLEMFLVSEFGHWDATSVPPIKRDVENVIYEVVGGNIDDAIQKDIKEHTAKNIPKSFNEWMGEQKKAQNLEK